MPQEREDNGDAGTENDVKPTITIAEKEDQANLGEKPTITIAEKDGGS